jgi:hypothetical protein
MLVLHVHIVGKHGNIERTYDFLRYDGNEELEGCDIIIPYNEEHSYPIQERDAVALIPTAVRGDH